MKTSTMTHDPEARLDYKWDWSRWLEEGETITAQTVTVVPDDDTLVIESSSLADDDKAVMAWVSGGDEGRSYSLVCHITTSAGRQDDRTITVAVWDR